LTGDHIETAKYVALECGIVQEDEVNKPGVCMTGDDFMEAIGGYNRIWDKQMDEYIIKFVNEDQFSAVRKKLKVLARTSSEDKFVLVSGTKQKGGIVSMTGDSISDAESLKKAEVSLCMGSGCDVAKDSSDLVILDNNF
jgi:magnesium-transporting ATPase (P-type)